MVSGSIVLPRGASGEQSSGTVSLGTPNNQFSDLYLSGNILTSSTGSLHSQLISSGGDAKLSLVCSDSHDAWINFSGATNEMSLGYDRGASSLIFSNGDTLGASERMRLTSTGNLLVGVSAFANNTLGVAIRGASSGATDESIRCAVPSTGSVLQIGFYNGNGRVGSVSTSGSATAYNTSSDQRLKENIVDADDAGSKIDAIQVRKFDWKADGSHQDYGMVAQELLEVAPEAVSAPEDPDEMMGVDYSKLVPMMLKEIQSLRARIAQLES